jgi:septum formation protein
MKQIILASASPRRKELLKKAGIKFKAIKSEIDERIYHNANPYELVKKLSLEKAKNVFMKNKKSIIIAADTIVVFDNKILGKPKDENDAKKMLSILSGNEHSIITGFTIINENKIITKSQETKVYMRKITDNEIDSYIKTKEPSGKAGAYAIQGIAKKFVTKIKGDLSNAIGLPIDTLLKNLKAISQHSLI